MKESKLEQDGNKLAKAMGWIVHKLDGGTGEPDRIYTRNGRVFYVEWKAPTGGVIGKRQHAWRTKIVASGTPHYFCSSLERFRDILLEQDSC